MMYNTMLYTLALVASLSISSSSAFVVHRPEQTAFSASSRTTSSLSSPWALHSTTSTTATTTTESDSTTVGVEGNVILFDGVCNFCNTWVDILLRIDVNEKFRFAPLQSTIGQQLLVAVGKDKDDISSVILVTPGANQKTRGTLQYYDKSNCVLKVVEELGPIAKVLTKGAEAIVPIQIRDTIYDTVAENRYNLMGKRDLRSDDPKYSDRFL